MQNAMFESQNPVASFRQRQIVGRNQRRQFVRTVQPL
jgi:hypothetical protein